MAAIGSIMIGFLKYPGIFPELDRDLQGQTYSLLMNAESNLVLASLALMLFKKEFEKSSRAPSTDEWERRRDKRMACEKEIEKERGVGQWDYSQYAEIRNEASMRLVAEAARDGVLPSVFEHQLQFLHAKSFLYALDSIRKTFLALRRIEATKDAADEALSILSSGCPDLAGVRDSTAHAEERAQGKAKGKSIPSKPVSGFGIEAPGGAIVISGLCNDVFNCTIEDGRLAGVAVNEKSLAVAYEAVQRLIDGLRWQGPPRVFPDY